MNIAALVEDFIGLPSWVRGLISTLGGVVLLLAVFHLWNWHERSIGAKQCKDEQAAKQSKIDQLQAELDSVVAKKNADLHARYDALNPKANYEPVAIPGCDRVPDDWVRSVNQAHARQ